MPFVAIVAALVFGAVAALQQHRYQPIHHDPTLGATFSRRQIAVVVLILACAIATNYLLDFPALGVWIGIVLGATFSQTCPGVNSAMPGWGRCSCWRWSPPLR